MKNVAWLNGPSLAIAVASLLAVGSEGTEIEAVKTPPAIGSVADRLAAARALYGTASRPAEGPAIRVAQWWRNACINGYWRNC